MKRNQVILRWIAAALIALLVGPVIGPAPQPAQAVSPTLVISQVYGAGGNNGAVYRNDFIEIFNRGVAPVSLNGYSLQYASATGTGNFSANLVVLPGASLYPGQHYLVKLASGGTAGAELPAPDLTGSTMMSASSGKVALVSSASGLPCNGSSSPCSPADLARIVDLVGYGAATFYEGSGPAPTLGAATSGARKLDGCQDTDDNAADFALQTPAPRNTASPSTLCGADQSPYVTATSPAPGAVFVSLDTNIQITFSEPVNTADTWFTLSCDGSGSHSAAVSGGPVTFVVNPDVDFNAGEICRFNILAANVSDQDALDPPNNMAADFSWTFLTFTPQVRIRHIQGAGHISPLVGLAVIGVPGIVTARRSTGFFMQDSEPDSSPATSEGIFVYTATPPAVSAGDSVTVSGTVDEYRPGGAGSANLTTTEITQPVVSVVSSGHPLPVPVELGSGAVAGRIPPGRVIEDDTLVSVETGGTFDPAEDGIDFYESLEGMLVQIDHAAAVGPTSAYGEIPVVSDEASAGLRTTRGGIVVQADDFNPERVILDDEVLRDLPAPLAMPAVNVGDSFAGGVVGVMDYSFGSFKLEVIQPPILVPGGLTQQAASSPGPLELSVATLNVENLSAMDSADKFNRLAGIIIHNLRAPDLLALEEVQDNNGEINDGMVNASETCARLITAITSAGGPLYQFRQIDPQNNADGGAPGGNIRVVFLFRTDKGLSFIDRPGAGALTANSVVSDSTGAHLAYNPGRVAPNLPAFDGSRKPLAAEFTYRGQKLFVIANHFVSKGADQPLFGRYQPPERSSEVQRSAQAQAVNDFVDQILAQEPQASILVVGDLNDFPFSSTLERLTGSPAVLYNLIDTLPPAERYSYIYEGNSQALDHILVSGALLPKTNFFQPMHVNAEFTGRVSDHDPLLLRLNVGYTLFMAQIQR